MKMALLQNTVKDISQLSIVETLDEYTSRTIQNLWRRMMCTPHLHIHYNLLVNACVRYDATNTSTPSERRNVYTAAGAQSHNDIDESHEAQFSPDIDPPSDDFTRCIKSNKANHHLHHVWVSEGSPQKANLLYT